MDRYGHVATADAVFIELRKNHDCCQKVTWVRWLQYYLLLLVIRVLSVLSVFCVSSSFLLFYIFFLFIACCHCSCCSVPHVLPPLVLHHTFSPPPPLQRPWISSRVSFFSSHLAAPSPRSFARYVPSLSPPPQTISTLNFIINS